MASAKLHPSLLSIHSGTHSKTSRDILTSSSEVCLADAPIFTSNTTVLLVKKDVFVSEGHIDLFGPTFRVLKRRAGSELSAEGPDSRFPVFV